MAFKDTKIVWKLKQNVNMPYALHDESSEHETVAQNEALVQAQASSDLAITTPNNNAQNQSAQEHLTDPKEQSTPDALNTPIVNTPTSVLTNDNNNATVNIDSALLTTASNNNQNSNDNASVLQGAPDNKAQTTNNTNTNENDDVQLGKTQFTGQFKISTQNPVVNGEEVNLSVDSQRLPRWRTLPYRLRQKRADIYINQNAQVDFVQSLSDYLKKKGLTILPYDDSVHYLPSDILLLDKTDLTDAGITIYLQEGKKEVYRQLKAEFGDRV